MSASFRTIRAISLIQSQNACILWFPLRGSPNRCHHVELTNNISTSNGERFVLRSWVDALSRGTVPFDGANPVARLNGTANKGFRCRPRLHWPSDSAGRRATKNDPLSRDRSVNNWTKKGYYTKFDPISPLEIPLFSMRKRWEWMLLREMPIKSMPTFATQFIIHTLFKTHQSLSFWIMIEPFKTHKKKS
jgi:hypothetical protein